MSAPHLGPTRRALAHFQELTVEPLPEGLDPLRDEIDRHLLALQKLARTNEMMPLDLAEAIASGLHHLLDRFGEFSPQHQAAVAGAARYFISSEDELPDRESILGLDDDAAIFNYVAELVGHTELRVEL